MLRILTYLTIAFAVGACSSGGSPSEPVLDDGTNSGNPDNSGDPAVPGAGDPAVPGAGDPAVPGAGDPVAPGAGDPAVPDGTEGGSTTFGQYGTISLDEYDGMVELEASFVSIPRQFELSELFDVALRSSDRCDVNKVTLDFTNPEIPEIDTDFFGAFSDFTLLSAGEVLTVSSPAGSYVELTRRMESFGGVESIFYEIDEDASLVGPAPVGLRISIPGDQFPAFPDVAIPSVEPLRLNSPANLDSVTASTAFSWDASSNPESFLEIYATSIDIASGEFISVDCEVVDDGSFSFPADIQSQMGATFAAPGSMDRVVVNVIQEGDTLLIVGASTEYSE